MALPMMWPIIHQCTIWESLMNQFWMNITEWPRFLHPLVGYPLNPPLSTSHYARMTDAHLNTPVSYDLWIWLKTVFIFTCHPSYMVCWWVLVHSGWDFTWKFIIKGAFCTQKIPTSGASSSPGHSQVTPSSDCKWHFDSCNFDGSERSSDRHPEGLSLYMGMGMFLCIIQESSSYSLWNQKKNWSFPKGKIWVKICLFIFER
jgi:hypothetical protein